MIVGRQVGVPGLSCRHRLKHGGYPRVGHREMSLGCSGRAVETPTFIRGTVQIASPKSKRYGLTVPPRSFVTDGVSHRRVFGMADGGPTGRDGFFGALAIHALAKRSDDRERGRLAPL